MKLDDYLSVIAQSAPKDWSVSKVPTFMFRLVPIRGADNRTLDFELQEHNALMVFKRDIRFSLAFGLVQNPNFNDDWATNFPNKRAQAVILDFMFAGALVFRDTLIAVDGWKCLLPAPAPDMLEAPFPIPEKQYLIAKLVHMLAGPNTNFEAYFQRAGMRATKMPWPG
ncbi:MAG: hypothetical protein KJ904_11760 [Alphaproteobacteria bacterium]|nr:hypothetical protein [Alphaproteobacteria bacterium]MBU0797770.1 hypothetical protein [Alphaproteobacteria bacterium]MBU0887832.1 hypothetical protein [Alphaproteobacteria bacterium]MBU1814945.1 hypothetical protein [Alphaproteobacteria bacterium]MBU2090289.1 hypothetical protein [Alphaproteobacteria bacterium]